jgi:putative transposase
MKMSKFQSYEIVGRNHPVHQPVFGLGNQAVIIFLTVNTYQRKPILTRPDSVQTLIAAWQKSDAWLVGRYLIMPDHLHLFCAPRDVTISLQRWVKF